MATSFHLFPHLPWEIRSRIWELTIEPRTVDVRISHEWEDVSNDVKAKYNHSRLGPLRSRSSTPVPAPLQACREARSHLGHRFYHKAFKQLPAARSDSETVRCDTPEDRLELGLEAGPRYIWVNFDVDLVDTGDTPFKYFESHFLDLKRWKFARDRYSMGDEAKVLGKVVNAKEISAVCVGPRGASDWEGTYEQCCVPCDKDRFWLIDPIHGRTVNAVENDALCDEAWVRDYRKAGAYLDPHTMQPFVPYLPPGWFEGRERWDVIYRWSRGYEESYR